MQIIFLFYTFKKAKKEKYDKNGNKLEQPDVAENFSQNRD